MGPARPCLERTAECSHAHSGAIQLPYSRLRGRTAPLRFFFADSQDLINPGFDFEAEEHDVFRLRQRDDRYPHEVLSRPPYEGLLVSKSIVDGTNSSSGRYTVAQRNRL